MKHWKREMREIRNHFRNHRPRPRFRDHRPPWQHHTPGQQHAASDDHACRWPPHQVSDEDTAWARRLRHHPPWPHSSPRARRLVFLRFAGAFGFMALLVVGGLAAMAFLLARLFGGGRHTALLVWVVACGVVVALPLLAARLAKLAYTRIAAPLADVITAADALAEGDLSARVEQHEGEFGGLARSFNRMAEELEAADQRRRRLTADVAHELRTPLQIIQGNLEGIVDGIYEPNDAHVQATLDETRLLARLIDDLRTLSLAEAGQLPLRCEMVDVADLLADIETSFGGQAEALDLDLTTQVHISEDAARLYGDVGRLDQVLGNLVANALRYTPAGGTIAILAEMDATGTRLRVRDTGAGIAAEDLPHVFDRFWKKDTARTHHTSSGSGLGLAIVRQLVRAHGGEVTVSSALGEGTAFTITLPPAPEDLGTETL